jgi:outer membrane protein assembly factor BamB
MLGRPQDILCAPEAILWRTARGACLVLFLLASTASAQVRFPRPSGQFELSDTVQIDRADGTVLARLERVKACLKEHQWDEAVETLRQVAENAEGKLLEIAPGHFVNLSDACQRKLAALPPEALKLYRSRVDPVARKWYEEGFARRDAKLLENVVNQAFASSFGDKALTALGEIRLEEANFSAARWCWERILPVQAPPGAINTWPGYPDTTLDPASIRARLVLVSILEGSTDRARDELSRFTRLHGDARGRLGGQTVRYADALAKLLDQSRAWPKPPLSADWPTFAGSPARRAIAPEVVDVAAVLWRAKFGRAPVLSAASPAVADDAAAPLSFHPVISDGRIFVADASEVFGYRADSCRPAWGDSGPSIYREAEEFSSSMGVDQTFGAQRFTLTIADGRLYARLGAPMTNPPQQAAATFPGGSILCFDLRAEAKLLWRANAEEGWAFDGTPIVDGERLFVAMRRADIRPQSHVACFDTTTGRMRWRRFIGAAETPARAALAEYTSNLLTLAGGTIYVNTNLGAVAAVAADSGRINWLSLYPRALHGSLARMDPHWSRDLNPCLFDRGRLYVAPADSPKVYAFDAGTGQILWPGRDSDKATGNPVQDPLDDVVHLLGVRGDYLIASGYRLYWIRLSGPRAGNIAHVWPQGPDRLGFGRGLLTESRVYWPTRDKIISFDPQTAQLKKEIELGPLGVRGGNLLEVNGHLLIVASGELIMLGTHGRNHRPQAELTSAR